MEVVMVMGWQAPDNSEYLREMADTYSVTSKRGVELPDYLAGDKWVKELASIKGVAFISQYINPIRIVARFEIAPEILEEVVFRFGKTHWIEHVTGPNGNALMRPQSLSALGLNHDTTTNNSEVKKIAEDYLKNNQEE